MDPKESIEQGLLSLPPGIITDAFLKDLDPDIETVVVEESTLAVVPSAGGPQIVKVPVKASPEIVAVTLAGAMGHKGVEFTIVETATRPRYEDRHVPIGYAKKLIDITETTTRTFRVEFLR